MMTTQDKLDDAQPWALALRVRWLQFLLRPLSWVPALWNTGPWAKTQHVMITRALVRMMHMMHDDAYDA